MGDLAITFLWHSPDGRQTPPVRASEETVKESSMALILGILYGRCRPVAIAGNYARWPSLYNSFEDRAPVDVIYACLIFERGLQ